MYFVIKRSGSQFIGYAYGGNNEIVWTTERYNTKASAQNAIAMLKSGAASAPVYDRT